MICEACDGSGEGMQVGTRCPFCHGLGEVPGSQDPDDPSEDGREIQKD